MRLRPVIEIGGTHATAALVDTSAWTVEWTERRGIDAAAGAEDLLDAIAAPALKMPSPHEACWGVAIPGPFDYENGIGDFTGIGKFWSLHKADVGAALARRLPSPADRLVFLNDAEAFALGEWALARPGPARAVYLTLGTGIGSCFLADGRPAADHFGLPPSGHVHLLDWRGKPLEDWVSRRAILRDYKEASGRDADVREIADLARGGDEAASRVLEHSFTTLGLILAPCIGAFKAECVVVGGSIARSWDLARGPLEAGLASAFPAGVALPELRRASGLDSAPILGAALAATRVS
ncbi:MAG: ROK family protein [Propionibacteriaceae bacterium]|nr:ROK family protein [Propionibacteriaceae bacterium]